MYDFRVNSKSDLIDAVQTFGIVPYFSTSIPGFSLEEHCHPSVLFSEDDENTWFWKGPVIRETRCAYGKFFEKKAAYVRSDLFLDLANYRRDGYDFDARYDDGLAKYSDKELFELIDRLAPVVSKDRRRAAKRALILRLRDCRNSATSLPATLSIPWTRKAAGAAGVRRNTARRKNGSVLCLQIMYMKERRKSPMTVCCRTWRLSFRLSLWRS